MIELQPSEPRPLDTDRLLFIRWLAIHGRIGRIPEGRPEGDAVTAVIERRGRSAIDKLVLPRTLREHIQKVGDY